MNLENFVNLGKTWKRPAMRTYGICAWGIVSLLAPLNLWAFVVYRHESAEVARIALEHCGTSEAPSERMRALVRFVAFEVPSKNTDRYFLLPVFKGLRPTPLQIIESGGDCSYKGRALVALLQSRGIAARKLSLHRPNGAGVHAVVQVDTERGPYIADALYGFALEHADGSPMSLEELERDADLIHDVLARETARGNPKTHRYPIHKYVYSDVRSYNLEQYRLTAAVRRILVWVFGKNAIDRFPRLNLFTEPALAVMWSSAALTVTLLVPLAAFRGRTLRQSVDRHTDAAQASIAQSVGSVD